MTHYSLKNRKSDKFIIPFSTYLHINLYKIIFIYIPEIYIPEITHIHFLNYIQIANTHTHTYFFLSQKDILNILFSLRITITMFSPCHANVRSCKLNASRDKGLAISMNKAVQWGMTNSVPCTSRRGQPLSGSKPQLPCGNVNPG